MDKILITGANGFLGSHLIDLCVKKEVLIYGIDLPNSSYKNLVQYTNGKEYFNKKHKYFGKKILLNSSLDNLKFLECNILDNSLIEKIINDISPNYIFHFGGQPNVLQSWKDPKGTIETNVIGTINIFESVKKSGIKSRVIFAGSATEFGSTTDLNRPLNESDPLLPLHPYGISKLASELLSRQYYINFGIDAINLRFFNLTGLRRTGDAASDFTRKIAQIELNLADPIIQVGNLESYRDIVNVLDAVQAIWLAATKGVPGETYQVCSGEKVQIRELLNIALSFSTKQIEIVENTPDKLRLSDEDVIVGDNSKIKSELDWSPHFTIYETLKSMFQYWIDFYKNTKK